MIHPFKARKLRAQIERLEAELAVERGRTASLRGGLNAAISPFRVEAYQIELDLSVAGDPITVEMMMRAHLPADAIEIYDAAGNLQEVLLPGRFNWDQLAQAFIKAQTDGRGGASASW